ncbi:hypothetical protein HDV02_004317 [Globomyces sp. JEL0801]|nr:hypothetical protein HDV02_004317 [Globomyces sp. JEL0801]
METISFVCILVFAYIGYYLEKAPVTGRLRYMNIDPEVELNLGIDELHEYIESIRDCILPKGHPMHRMVERIAKELIKGMMLLSKACYDPKEAIDFHKRLGENQDPDANMEYLSTHPLATTRIGKLEQAMPHAKHLWSDSKCDKV